MAEVRLLAPWTDDKGDHYAAGEVVDVSDEDATALNNRGMASLVSEEKKLEEQHATSAVYGARLQRAETPAGKAQTGPPPSEETPKKKA